MKKFKAKRILAFLLTVITLIQVMGAGGLAVFAAGTTERSADNSELVYEQDFNTGIWTVAPKTVSTGQSAKSVVFTAPTVKNGVMYMVQGDTAAIWWEKIPGIKKSGTYTMKFDVKVTDFGNDDAIPGGISTWKRELYVALGGWWDSLYFESGATNPLYAAKKTAGAANYSLNTTYSVTLEWDKTNKRISASMTSGEFSLSGTRDYSGSADIVAESEPFWAFRCEDGACEVSNFSFTDGEVTVNGFGDAYATLDDIGDNGLWTEESKNYQSAVEPFMPFGEMHLDEKSSVSFNWTNFAGAYNSTTTYTFDFDFKITDFGNDYNATQTRPLYIGHNGYYTQLSFYDKDKNIAISNGNTKVTVPDSDVSKYLNKWMHVSMVWVGNSVTTKVTFENGTLIGQGQRTFTIDTNANSMVMRCEDGAAVIDNFKFTATEVEKPVSNTSVTVPEGQAAVYECDVTYSGEDTKVVMGNYEFLSLSNGVMKMVSCVTNGSYGAGTYHVKVNINPTQKLFVAEVTLPNGGIVRRGASLLSTVRAFSIEVYGADDCVSNVKTAYTNISVDEYSFITDEPMYEGFGANVYNLVTSFTDARYDRAFAWTALQSYIGSDAMAVKYREADKSEWTVSDAVKENESFNSEYYFKADISGLKAGTKYEYRIGKKNSGDENDWSRSYFFTTAAQNVSDFSFVAIGDTQPHSWNGTTTSNKGAMLAQSALAQAFSKTSPAFILHTGDVTENSHLPNEWNLYLKALGEYGATTPHFAAIGNHDGGNLFDVHFNHPNNGGSAAVDKNTAGAYFGESVMNYLDETVYSYNYGDVHFIVLNSGKYVSEDKYLLEAQRAWLIGDLEANKNARWTVIMQHQTAYHRLGGAYDKGTLADVIERYGVDLVIQGHSHLVTRTYPMKNGQIVTKVAPDVIEKGVGTIYTTIGSTTVNHDSIGNPNMECMMNIVTTDNLLPAYTVVEVEGDNLVVTTRQVDGLVLDTFTIVDNSHSSEDGVTALYGNTLELGTDVKVKFVLDIDTAKAEGAKVQIGLESDFAEGGDAQKIVEKDISELETAVIGNKTYYVVELGVPAKDIALNVKTRLAFADGSFGTEYVYSAQDYIDKVLEMEIDEDYTAELKALVSALDVYGKNAAAVLAGGAGAETIENVDFSAVTEATGSKSENLKAHLTHFSLELKSNIKLRVYFSVTSGALDKDDFTVKVNGEERNATDTSNKYIWCIEETITAAQLNDTFSFTIEANDGSGTLTLNLSALYYAKTMAASAKATEAEKNLMKAIKLYYDAAAAYMAAK